MYSKLTLWYLSFCTDLAFFGGAIPFRSVKRGRGSGQPVKIEMSPVTRRVSWKIFHWGHNCLNLVYIVFVAFRLSGVMAMTEHTGNENDKRNYDEKVKLPLIVQLMYVLTCYLLNMVFNIETWYRGDVIPYFLSQYVNFFTHLHASYKKTSSSKTKVKCNHFLTVLFTVGNLIYVQNFMLMMKKPDRLHFFTSLLANPKKTPIPLKLPLMLLQCWVWFNLWSNIYAYVFPIYIYNCGGIYVLRELNPKFNNLRTTASLRERTTFIRTVNTFRVLHNLFKYTYRDWYEPMQKGNAMSVAVLAVYGMIRLEGRQARIMSLAATFAILYLASLYRKLGLMFDASQKMRESWLNAQTTSVWMRKWLRAIPEFRVDVAGYYFVQRTTVVNVLYGILNATISLLLAY